MATARVALGSIFRVVSDTAGAASSVINSTTRSVGMLDKFVTKAAEEQRKNHLRDEALFDERLKIEYSREKTSLQLEADEYCNKSDRHAQLFNAAYAEMESLLNPQNTSSN